MIGAITRVVRVRGRVVGAAVIAAAVAMPAVSSAAPPSTARLAATRSSTLRASAPATEGQIPTLRIVAQPFNVLTSVNARFVVATTVATENNDVVELRLHRRVASRESLRTIAEGAAIPAVIDRHRARVSSLARDEGGRLVVQVPMDLTDDPRALVLPFDGIYPLTVAIVDGDTGADLASSLTFLNRRDPATETPLVAATTIVNLTAPVSLALDGPTVVTEDLRLAVRRFLAALSETTAPLTVVVQPEVIAALGDSLDPVDVELFSALAERLSQRSVTAAAFLHVDPAVLTALGLADEWVEQLRFGTATLNRYMPAATVRADAIAVTTALDRPTVDVLRGAGIGSVLLVGRGRDGIEAEARASVLSHPAGRDNEVIAVSSADPTMAELLATPSAYPVETAHRIAAEMIAERDDQLAAGVAASWIRLAVASPNGSLSDDGVLTIVQRALAGSPGISMTDFAARPSVTAEHPAIVFPSSIEDPGNSRRDGLVAARRELDAIVSMTADDDPRRERWERMLAVGASDQVDDPPAWVSALRDDLGAVRRSIVVTTPSNITLSSRSTSIRLQVRNDSEAPLTVRVRFTSAKLRLTDPVRMVELSPGALTEIVVPATTRTNGRFPVSVRITTPAGGLEVVPTIRITARVTVIAGLGQLVSISLLLVLLAWWWSNRRRAWKTDRKTVDPPPGPSGATTTGAVR